MSKFERIVHVGSMLVLLFAVNRASQWLQTGELFPKPEPVLYEGNLGKPEDWAALLKPPAPILDRHQAAILEAFQRQEESNRLKYARPPVESDAEVRLLLGEGRQ